MAQGDLPPRGPQDGLAPVVTADRWGYIDKTGKLAIAPQFEIADPFSDGRALVGVGGKFGYINTKGAFVINPQFNGAGRFSDKLAPIAVNVMFFVLGG